MEELCLRASVVEIMPREEKKDFVYQNVLVERQLGAYTQKVLFQFQNQRVDLVDQLRQGKEYDFVFDIKCRENQEKPGLYFINLICYALKRS